MADIKDKKTAKGLKSQLSALEGEMDGMKSEIANRQKELSSKKKMADALREKISLLDKPEKPKVSEHAMLRYLERVKGINIEELEKEILSDKVMDMVGKLGGSGKYSNEKGCRVVMKDNVVVTVIEK